MVDQKVVQTYQKKEKTKWLVTNEVEDRRYYTRCKNKTKKNRNKNKKIKCETSSVNKQINILGTLEQAMH